MKFPASREVSPLKKTCRLSASGNRYIDKNPLTAAERAYLFPHLETKMMDLIRKKPSCFRRNTPISATERTKVRLDQRQDTHIVSYIPEKSPEKLHQPARTAGKGIYCGKTYLRRSFSIRLLKNSMSTNKI